MKLQRVQIEIPEDRLKELDQLAKLTGLETRKDLFNNALSLLEWAVKEVGSGRTIASVDEAHKSFRELQMPIFSVAKKRWPQLQGQMAELMTR